MGAVSLPLKKKQKATGKRKKKHTGGKERHLVSSSKHPPITSLRQIVIVSCHSHRSHSSFFFKCFLCESVINTWRGKIFPLDEIADLS